LTGLDLVHAAAANAGIVLDGSSYVPSTPSKGSQQVDTAAALAAAAQVAADQLTTLPPEVQELAGKEVPMCVPMGILMATC
jgi:hypothetical protein